MFIISQKKLLKDLMETPPDTLSCLMFREVKEYARPEGFDAKANEEKGSFGFGDKYGYEHHTRCYNHRKMIEGSQRDVKRLEKRLLAWKPQ